MKKMDSSLTSDGAWVQGVHRLFIEIFLGRRLELMRVAKAAERILIQKYVSRCLGGRPATSFTASPGRRGRGWPKRGHVH